MGDQITMLVYKKLGVLNLLVSAHLAKYHMVVLQIHRNDCNLNQRSCIHTCRTQVVRRDSKVRKRFLILGSLKAIQF